MFNLYFRQMDIQLRISDYSSHKDLISVLSPLFEVGNDESIRFGLDMPFADETICIYPDYFCWLYQC